MNHKTSFDSALEIRSVIVDLKTLGLDEYQIKQLFFFGKTQTGSYRKGEADRVAHRFMSVGYVVEVNEFGTFDTVTVAFDWSRE